MIDIKWDGDEAIIILNPNFIRSNWITRMDCLADAIAMLTDYYNSELSDEKTTETKSNVIPFKKR